MKIHVIGSGYIGLTTAAVFAHLGHDVVGYDVLEETVAALRDGQCPIHEPGLPDLLPKVNAWHHVEEMTKVVMETTEPGDEVLFIICVGTPQAPTGETDGQYVVSAVDAAVMASENCANFGIFVKSTMPPEMVKELDRTQPEPINGCPEFLREGTAIVDTFFPDRVVVGGPDSKLMLKAMADVVNGGVLYRSTATQYRPLPKVQVCKDAATTMLVKYAANAFLATKISFVNDLARLCDEYGVDVDEVTEGMGTDSRISPKFLGAGLGWGGSCFPKDTESIVAQGKSSLVDFHVVQGAIRTNNLQPRYVTQRVDSLATEHDLRKYATVYGLTFKPNTDDVRESLAIELVKLLTMRDWNLTVDDPKGLANFLREHPTLASVVLNDKATTLDNRVAIIATDWPQYTDEAFAVDLVSRGAKLVYDCRNCLTAEAREVLRERGVSYYGVGRRG